MIIDTPSSPSPTRYTVDGSAGFEQWLSQSLEQLGAAVAALPVCRQIFAVILGGSYGRGEGGIFHAPDGREALYNDLDLFVLVHGIERRERRRVDQVLRELGSAWSAKLGVDVDFAPCRTVRSLHRVGHTLMYRELKAGHRLLYGPVDALASLPAFDWQQLPFAEGNRLLLNRGTGLALAAHRLRQPEPGGENIDFIARNIFKALLGCGDAFLIARRQYGPGIRERTRSLRQAAPAELADWYEKAMAFKFQPGRPELEALPDLWRQALELWLSTCRNALEAITGRELPTPEAQRNALKNAACLHEGSRWRNCLLNIRSHTGNLLQHPRRQLLIELHRYLTTHRQLTDYRPEERQWKDYFQLWQRFN